MFVAALAVPAACVPTRAAARALRYCCLPPLVLALVLTWAIAAAYLGAGMLAADVCADPGVGFSALLDTTAGSLSPGARILGGPGGDNVTLDGLGGASVSVRATVLFYVSSSATGCGAMGSSGSSGGSSADLYSVLYAGSVGAVQQATTLQRALEAQVAVQTSGVQAAAAPFLRSLSSLGSAALTAAADAVAPLSCRAMATAAAGGRGDGAAAKVRRPRRGLWRVGCSTGSSSRRTTRRGS
jgi:hypothetical protein